MKKGNNVFSIGSYYISTLLERNDKVWSWNLLQLSLRNSVKHCSSGLHATMFKLLIRVGVVFGFTALQCSVLFVLWKRKWVMEIFTSYLWVPRSRGSLCWTQLDLCLIGKIWCSFLPLSRPFSAISPEINALLWNNIVKQVAVCMLCV